MDIASRASKKAQQGLFCPPGYSAGRCCSNPPLRVKLKIPDKTKNQRIFYAGLFGGRGWISRAALLKTAHWAVFAPSSATSPQLFESTLEGETLGLDKTKTSAYLCTLRFFGGRGWIRTTEAESSRFTVCPHWPLGNTPIFIFVRPFAGRLAYFSMGNGFCQLFFTFFFKGFLHPLKAGCGNAAGFVRKRRTSVFFAAKIFIG